VAVSHRRESLDRGAACAVVHCDRRSVVDITGFPRNVEHRRAGLSGVRTAPVAPGNGRLGIHCVRSSKSAEYDRAKKEEDGTDRNDVELQGNVHEGGSMAIYDEQSLAEKRRPARGNDIAMQ
jgi:hypothetical protein